MKRVYDGWTGTDEDPRIKVTPVRRSSSSGVYSIYSLASLKRKWTPLPKNKQSLPRNIWDIVKKVYADFCNQTSLHALKYLVDSNQTAFVRCLWGLAIIASWAFGVFMIHLFWEKWKESPILVSFDDDLSPIWQIPFPAITICNMNKILKSKVKKISALALKYPENQTFSKELLLVEEICASSESSKKHKSMKKKMMTKGKAGGKKKKTLDGATFHHYLQELSVSCSNMILRCDFGGMKQDCSRLFIDVVTDDGKCCAFNIMPDEIMFSHLSKNPELEKDWEDWTPQDGYTKDPSIHHDEYDRAMPKRSSAPGLTMGLSVLLNVQENEYYCSGSESVGFKMLLHSPVDHPEMVDFGFGLSPGSESYITLLPDYIHSKHEIKSIDYKIRQCFFEDERKLQFFSHFTYVNCIIECITNFTQSMCGCVAYHMPRTDDIPICPPEEIGCIKKAKLAAEESNIVTENGGSSENSCECLPSCTEIHYPHEASQSTIRNEKMLKLSPEEISVFKGNSTMNMKDMSILHIYFKSLNFIRHERGQLYGPIEFIANIGGILGLCAGSSLLSVGEILYFYGVKLLSAIVGYKNDALMF